MTPVIVEFAGLSGAGKSTLVATLTERHPGYAGFFFPMADKRHLLHPAAVADLVRYGEVAGSPMGRVLLRRLVGHRVGLRRLGHAPDLFLDGGLVQTAWRALFPFTSGFDVARLHRLVIADWPLVIVSASGADRFDRLRRRSRLGEINQHLVDAGLDSELWRTSEVVHAELADLAARHRPVVRVTSTRPVEDLAAEVEKALGL